MSEHDLTCLTLNVKGIRDKTKRLCIFKWLLRQKAHVYFLQETHITEDIALDCDRDWKGTTFHCFGTSNSRGVSILFNPSIDVSTTSFNVDSVGRKLLVNCKCSNDCYSFANVYAPNTIRDRNSFFRELPAWLYMHQLHNLIIAGDFNCIVDMRDFALISENWLEDNRP